MVGSSGVTYQGYFSDQTGTFLGHALQLANAAKSLDEQRFGIARNMLLGQATECALKAWLYAKMLDQGKSQQTVITALSKKPLGHDLKGLWDASVAYTLQLSNEKPLWFETLVLMHGYPYRIRYPQGGATVFPAPSDDVCDSVVNLVDFVGASLGRKRSY